MHTIRLFLGALLFPVMTSVWAEPPFPPPNHLAAKVAALEARVAALEAKLANVSLNPNPINGLAGPHLIISGANVHIRNGDPSAVTTTENGLGNLVIGYNELPDSFVSGERDGSHNLIVGYQHRYSSVGGLVAGNRNTISGQFASVISGVGNTASGFYANVSGGVSNTASGQNANVSGGFNNTASGDYSSVSAGHGCTEPRSLGWSVGDTSLGTTGCFPGLTN